MPEREMERISCPSGASSYNIYADGAFVVSAQSTSCDAQGLTDATTYSFTGKFKGDSHQCSDHSVTFAYHCDILADFASKINKLVTVPF